MNTKRPGTHKHSHLEHESFLQKSLRAHILLSKMFSTFSFNPYTQQASLHTSAFALLAVTSGSFRQITARETELVAFVNSPAFLCQ